MHPVVRSFSILGLVLLFPLTIGLAEVEASIDPQVADFGEVLVGETRTVPVHITNHDPMTSLNVALFLQEGSAGFILETYMLVLGPGETKTVSVTYTSSGEGEVSDTLVITYLGGRMPEEVLLTAVGVQGEAPVGVHTVAAFFDRAVEQGTLKGVGPGRSAEHRLGALQNMILEAEALVGMGDFAEGCERLQAAAGKLPVEEGAGGRGKGPAVFAEGESAPELASLIEAACESLCGEEGTELARVESGS